MSLDTEYLKFALLLKKVRRVCILSHRSPDGDTIGSNIALGKALSEKGIEVISVCADTIDPRYRFLPEVVNIKKTFDLSTIDMIISVDIATKHLLGFEEKHDALFSFYPFINIDHHPDNQLFGNVNIVDETAASTTMVLSKLFNALDIPISREMATALMLGLYTDTGSFMHANTSPESYQMASFLTSKGANIKAIIQNMFKYFPINRLHLWGEVFQHIQMNRHQVVSSVVTSDDFKRTSTSSLDLAGVVEYLNMVPGGRYAMLLTEDEKTFQVKASLRTLNDDVDVSKIAHQYGGGGHKKASGFRVDGKIEEEVTYKIVNDHDGDVLSNMTEMDKKD